MTLHLSDAERTRLRQHKIRKADLLRYTARELADRSGLSGDRCRELIGLATFQRAKSIGYGFASDLIYLGYYDLESLAAADPVELYATYERRKGYWVDPCVEDQFRKIVHFARTGDDSLSWFDFTAERKRYRAEHGYNADRPQTPWHEVVDIIRPRSAAAKNFDPI